MLWKYIPLSFSPRECFLLLFQPRVSNFVHTADICKIGLQAFYSAQHSLLRHYENLGMKLVAILEWKLCKARDDMPHLKLLLPVSLSLFTQLQHDLQDKSYGCGCEEHKCSALFLFSFGRFTHVRDVLAEALRLLPALGAASHYPLDSVIPDKRHEHCNPSGSHYTRYILFRYGCWIWVSASLSENVEGMESELGVQILAILVSLG